uniref:Uncharacterized protein n=1 Tax=Parascaris equorum TaxID=6256 RepID=A0A914R460_PAREQ
MGRAYFLQSVTEKKNMTFITDSATNGKLIKARHKTIHTKARKSQRKNEENETKNRAHNSTITNVY